jgi:hypothetical protein
VWKQSVQCAVCGLALICSKDYAGAMMAYETALVHDPLNTAAQSYLHKASQSGQGGGGGQ